MLELIAKIANRKLSQATMLYELCDKNMIKYIKLEAYIQSSKSSCIPGNKEMLERFLERQEEDNENEY